MKKVDINDLMTKYVLGTASEEECSELMSRADAEQVKEIMDADDFVEKYSMYDSVDADAAMKRFREKTKMERKWYERRWVRYAASFVVLMGAGIAGLMYLGNRSMEQGMIAFDEESRIVLPENVKQAISRSKAEGKMKAEVRKMSSREKAEVSEYRCFEDEELEEAHKVTTVYDKEYWMQLADGTMVHLNGGSRLIYPAHFYGSCRDVYLDGEAYFIVTKNKEHPFVVHTPHGEIKELGTEFNVTTYAEHDGVVVSRTEVVLVKGSIAVKAEEQDEEHIMTPGEMAVISSEGNMNFEKVDVEPYSAINSGQLEFRDKAFEEVITTLAKWYKKKVMFRNGNVRKILITGNFDRYDTLDNVLSSMSKTVEAKLYVSGEYIVVE